MIVLGFKKLRIHLLNFRGDFRDLLESPRIAERARSVARLGILSEPMVRKRDMRVIYGHDRIAAAIHCKATEVLCKLVDCTDDELREIELTENTHRRHDPDTSAEALNRLLDLYQEAIEEEKRSPIANEPYPQLVKPPSGRKPSSRGLARKRLAVEFGVDEKSIRKREQRHRQNEKARLKAEAEASGYVPIALLGMEVEEDFKEKMRALRVAMDRACVHAQRTLTELATIKREQLPFDALKFSRLYEELRVASAELRAHRPTSLCPYCKGLSGVQEGCTACLQTGWINEMQSATVPKDLWIEGERAVVAVAGRYEPVSQHLRRLASRQEPETEMVETAEDLFG